MADTPPVAAAPDEIVDVSAGLDSTCVVKGDGAVLCVGAGVGSDPDGESIDATTPRRIEGIPAMVEVEAGDGLWCARTAQGVVYCWRRSDRWEADEDPTVPKRVPLSGPAVELVVRGGFGCARTESAIECWPERGSFPLDFSYDSWGLTAWRYERSEGMELCFTSGGAGGCTDVGDQRPDMHVPDRVRTFHALLERDKIGADRRCWLTPRSTLDCFTVLDKELSVPGSASIHVTGSSACWTTSNGELFCSGDNRSGQLGRAGVESLIGSTRVEGVPPVAQLSVGSNHVCALTQDHRLWCWGRAVEGQLGHAIGVWSPTPVRADVEGVERVIAGGDRTCALTSEGWRCSGYVEGKSCGRATLSLPLPGVAADAELLLGGPYLCARHGSTLRCAEARDNTYSGSGAFGPRDYRIDFELSRDAPGGVVALERKVCSQDRKGVMSCGDEQSWKPAKPVDALVGGAWHVCGLRRDGKIECIDTVDWKATVQSLGLRGRPRQIASHGMDLCVVESDTVHCFGITEDGSPAIPVTIEGLPAKATAVAVGDTLACALGTDGKVACWDLGDGVHSYSRPRTLRARDVPLPEPAAEIAIGEHHACARAATGALYCWGDDHAGQLGDGTALCDFTPADRTDAFSRP